MTEFKIPDDISRWEKRGLREGIGTSDEHVHEIYVWKKLAIECEKWGCDDCEHESWNPYVLMDGHPMKLERGNFETFDEAVGYLKGILKKKELASEGEVEKDDEDDEDGLGIPEHPSSDSVVKKSISIKDLIKRNGQDIQFPADGSEIMNPSKDEGSGKEGEAPKEEKAPDFKVTKEKVPSANDKIIKDHAKSLEEKGITGRDGAPLYKEDEAGQSPAEQYGEAVNYQHGGKNGIPTAKVNIAKQTATVNGARQNEANVPNGNYAGRTVSNQPVAAAEAGKNINLLKLILHTLRNQNDDFGYTVLDSQGPVQVGAKPVVIGKDENGNDIVDAAGRGANLGWNLRVDGDTVSTQPARGFVRNFFSKNIPKMVSAYNARAKGVPSVAKLPTGGIGELTPAQLRSLLINEYQEKDEQGNMRYPQEIKHVPILGGIQYAKAGKDGGFIPVFGKDGSLNPATLAMLTSERDDLGGAGIGLTRNSTGFVPYDFEGVKGTHGANDITKLPNWGKITQLYGKELQPTDDMMLDLISEIASGINGVDFQNNDYDKNALKELLQSRFGDSSGTGDKYTSDGMDALLGKYMFDADGNPILDNTGQPITRIGAANLWGQDKIIQNRKDAYMDWLEPRLIRWMDNTPINRMQELFVEHPYLQRNMAMSDDERRKWYNDLYDHFKVKNRDIKGKNPRGAYSAYTSEDRFAQGKTPQEMIFDYNGTKPPKTNDVKRSFSIEDSIAYFHPEFVMNKADGDDGIKGEVPSERGDTEPRIAAYRTVSMGEDKESVFPLKLIDKTSGKVICELDWKS